MLEFCFANFRKIANNWDMTTSFRIQVEFATAGRVICDHVFDDSKPSDRDMVVLMLMLMLMLMLLMLAKACLGSSTSVELNCAFQIHEMGV